MNCYYTNPGKRKMPIARSTFMRAEEIDRERAMSGWNPYAGEEEMEDIRDKQDMPNMPPDLQMPRETEQRYDGCQREKEWQSGGYNRGQERKTGSYGQDNEQKSNVYGRDEERRSDVHGRDEEWRSDVYGRDEERRSDVYGRDEEWKSDSCRTGADNEERMPYFQRPDFAQVLEQQREEERDLRRLQSMYPEAAKLLLPFVEEECDKMEYEGSAMFDSYPDRTTVRRIQERIQEQVKDQFQEEQELPPDEMLSMQYQGPGRNRPGQNWLGDLIQIMLLQEMHHRRCRYRNCRRNRF